MKRNRLNKTKRMNNWALDVKNWSDTRAFNRAKKLQIKNLRILTEEQKA